MTVCSIQALDTDLKHFAAWWIYQRTEVAALLNWFEYLLMPFRISNNTPVLSTLCKHGVDYYKAMQRARSKFYLKSLYFSVSKESQFSILSTGLVEGICAGIRQ